LKRAGITRFEQIAAWSEEDIQRIAPQLGRRPNRIRKDGWIRAAVEQLKLLGREHPASQ
jgi:predicted flap endonuclease-1-like 5' DNA nuclease